MAFWDNWFSEPSGNTDSPGDPEGVEVNIESKETRSLPVLRPSAWAGWPAEWAVPNWDFGSRFNELIDIAWNCLDLNASVLSAMPVYRTRGGEVTEPDTWMINPDPTVYTSWHEFAKELFWDYQTGEAFVLPMAYYSDGWPMRFRVIPPWMIRVEMRSGVRTYWLGHTRDVTSEILHIRYKATSSDARGIGPLEKAGGRMLTAGVLAKYVREVVSTGGIQLQTLETDQELTSDDAQDLLNHWVETRAQNLGYPPVLDNNVKLQDHQSVSPKDMAMLEIAQFTEARIANLIGVPPFLVGLPATGGGGGESMTYSNVSQIFDFHDRSSLRPKAAHVMAALSNWALPRGQAAELNRDEYSRPAFNDRAEALVKLVDAKIMTTEEARRSERLTGEAPTVALTGGDLS
jgi:HK97 family phage portal protein